MARTASKAKIPHRRLQGRGAQNHQGANQEEVWRRLHHASGRRGFRPRRRGDSHRRARARCRARYRWRSPVAASSRYTAPNQVVRPPCPFRSWQRPRRLAASRVHRRGACLDPVYAAKIGVDIDELLISQPDTGEQALEICDMLVRSNAVSCIVIDPSPHSSHVRKSRRDRRRERRSAGTPHEPGTARKLAGSLSKSNTCCIFINQLREKIGVMFGNPETTTGGRALKFFSSVRLDIRRIETIKVDGGAVGNRVRVKVVKNKCSAPSAPSSTSCTVRAYPARATSSTWPSTRK